MMLAIAENSVVAFHSDIFNAKGEHVQTSRQGLPLLFLFGDNQIPKALQNAMLGYKKGDNLDVELTPDQAFGELDAELIQRVPMNMLPEHFEAKVGATLTAHTPDGEQVVRVTAFDDESVTLDGNHPLAGETLQFKIEIRNVRPASEDEIKKGYAIP